MIEYCNRFIFTISFNKECHWDRQSLSMDYHWFLLQLESDLRPLFTTGGAVPCFYLSRWQQNYQLAWTFSISINFSGCATVVRRYRIVCLNALDMTTTMLGFHPWHGNNSQCQWHHQRTSVLIGLESERVSGDLPLVSMLKPFRFLSEWPDPLFIRLLKILWKVLKNL